MLNNCIVMYRTSLEVVSNLCILVSS
uniref:Uncharacterized protein n=1 Tax=Arundo donax TaxID=35708 RepID=A0A0A9B817_ARUDO